MANGWNPARRAAPAAPIRNWKPWEQSTGPRTVDGKRRVARNAYQGNQRAELRRMMRHVRELLRDQRADTPAAGIVIIWLRVYW